MFQKALEAGRYKKHAEMLKYQQASTHPWNWTTEMWPQIQMLHGSLHTWIYQVSVNWTGYAVSFASYASTTWYPTQNIKTFWMRFPRKPSHGAQGSQGCFGDIIKTEESCGRGRWQTSIAKGVGSFGLRWCIYILYDCCQVSISGRFWKVCMYQQYLKNVRNVSCFCLSWPG